MKSRIKKWFWKYFSYSHELSFEVPKQEFTRQLSSHIPPLSKKDEQSKYVLVDSIEFFRSSSKNNRVKIRSNSFSIHAGAIAEIEGDDQQVKVKLKILPDAIFVIFTCFFFLVLLGVLVAAYWNDIPVIAAGGLVSFVLLFSFVFEQIRKGMKRMKESLIQEFYNVVKYL